MGLEEESLSSPTMAASRVVNSGLASKIDLAKASILRFHQKGTNTKVKLSFKEASSFSFGFLSSTETLPYEDFKP